MKKLYYILIPLLVGVSIVSCGISQGNSTKDSVTFSIVKAPVYDAKFQDADGNLITPTQVDGYKYTFAPIPKYPVSVVDGYYDANGDGKIEKNVDYKLPIALKTKEGSNITPLTTYLADLPAEAAKVFLQENNIADQEVFTLPLAAQTDAKMLAVNMAIYSALTQKAKSTAQDFNITQAFNTKLVAVKTYTDVLPLNEATKVQDMQDAINYLEESISLELGVTKADIDFVPPVSPTDATGSLNDNVTNDNVTSDNLTAIN